MFNAADGAGKTLGEYQLLEVIGQGGMAVVYRARQSRIDRDVAIKLIIPPYSKHPKLVKRFEDEARAVARMQHPHILPVLDVGVQDDQPFMVMTYVSGGTLTRRIATSGGMPLTEVVCIASEIAEALDYAHAQGIIHRDVKPGNVLLDAQGHAYLADFGVALLISGKSAEQDQQTPGTYAYMAPEVVYGAPASRASDIYALGMVIFEMLAGKRAYDVREKDELIAAMTAQPQPDLTEYRPDLPPGVRVAVMQALAADPESRPARASSLALVLTRAAGMDRLPCPPRPAAYMPSIRAEPAAELVSPPPEALLVEDVRTPPPDPTVGLIPRLSDEDMSPPPPSHSAREAEPLPTRPTSGVPTRSRDAAVTTAPVSMQRTAPILVVVIGVGLIVVLIVTVLLAFTAITYLR